MSNQSLNITEKWENFFKLTGKIVEKVEKKNLPGNGICYLTKISVLVDSDLLSSTKEKSVSYIPVIIVDLQQNLNFKLKVGDIVSCTGQVRNRLKKVEYIGEIEVTATTRWSCHK